MIVAPGMTEKKIHIMPIGGKNNCPAAICTTPFKSARGICRAGGLFQFTA
ncbi:MAG: hypothetical protein ACLSCR_10250 [Akkermansia sp.]